MTRASGAMVACHKEPAGDVLTTAKMTFWRALLSAAAASGACLMRTETWGFWAPSAPAAGTAPLTSDAPWSPPLVSHADGMAVA